MDHPDGTAVPIVIQLVVGHLVVVHLVVWLLCHGAFSCFCFCQCHLEMIFLSREKGTYLFWSYLLNLEWSVEADFLINIS